MLNEFLVWWLEQMRALIPPGLAGDGADPGTALVAVDRTAGGPLRVELLRRRRGEERSLGLFELAPPAIDTLREAVRRHKAAGRLVVRLQAGLLLERQVALPLLAERAPEQVLGYEMDRFTPFAGDEVFWAWAIERRDRARGLLHVRLSLVPKPAVQPLLAALAQAGLDPAGLEAPVPGGMRRIALRRAASGAQRWRRRGWALAGGGCGALAVAAIVLPFLLQNATSRRVERRYAVLAPQVARVEQWRRARAARAAGVDVFAAEQAHVGVALQVLAALTALLPDDTYLTDLTLNQGKLTLDGQSAAAVRLIAALSASPVIRNPAFAAPVTRVADGHADLFSIRAELAP